jgi:hypothetical protein
MPNDELLPGQDMTEWVKQRKALAEAETDAGEADKTILVTISKDKKSAKQYNKETGIWDDITVEDAFNRIQEQIKPRKEVSTQHDWVPSTLGHGELMCSRCRITNREASALNTLNKCEGA